MKEATGELNMTVITVIAIAAIGVFLAVFLPSIIKNIQESWNRSCETYDSSGNCTKWSNE
jgi:hypothetical protein